MTRIYLAMERELLVIQQQEQHWAVARQLVGTRPQCLALDPGKQERLYCGTFDTGIWRSGDGGSAWQRASIGLTQTAVMAIATGAIERMAGYAPVYAGTEPSSLFRSNDGGDTWQRLPGLTELPSAATWSFPPRPHTHHVRAIGLDPHDPRLVFVCIEAGALVRSRDGGQTWEDRVPGGPYDTHTLALHPRAPGRLYAAAGDGYFESEDRGETWSRPRTGLRHHYLWSIAVDPEDPTTMIVSASSGPATAHNAAHADSVIYRRDGGGAWSQATTGLPLSRGTTRAALATGRAGAGIFYAANNHGLFRSVDHGMSWQQLDIAWPEAYRAQCIQALIVDERC
jgi:photosystem II stability/assembly factor-like uncharacterized protein